MEERSVIHSTFVIERTYPANPERVFAAFADPAGKRRWFIESDKHKVEHYELDFRVGGREYARVRLNESSPLPGVICINDTLHLDIVPNRRIVIASTMTVRDRRISGSLGTLEFLTSEAGTDLIFTHQAAYFEGADGPDMREAGWRKLFDRLATEFTR
jgi:uncharacterized protein YndB with AHSA1/START domain